MGLTLPNYKNVPTHALELFLHTIVPLHVSGELGVPKVNVRLRLIGEPATTVSVPIAAVDKNHFSSSREY